MSGEGAGAPRVGVLALQGDVREHVAALTASLRTGAALAGLLWN